ncbi:alkaline phosphatase family protein [Bizionia sediminis]|uniref:Alkaline phosphatase family protein n=1 Tax=Bizionia sediminis TaxID=1737064 RepID=A0ABW5KU36_9FLAO
MKKNKVLLIGWDAADWKVIGPLLAKGQMPALKKLIDRGVYGNMSTMNPPYSPMLWSSVATGKTPDKHGVLGFIELMPDKKGIRPVTANSRKAKAIWNILHHKGFKSNLVGWWPSFPAEPINGVVVSDKFQKVNKDPNKKNPIAKGTIHPESFTEQLKDLRMFPYEITEAHILPCIPKAAKINQETDKGLESFAKILAENTSVHAAATNLIRTTEWDFTAVYYDLIDHFCHAFMRFHPPKQKHIPEEAFDIYKDAVVSSYRIQDMMLARKMELVDEDTTIIVMSDHGFESGVNRLAKMPKYPAAPALEHRQFGMFVAAGPNIKKNEKIFGLGLIDVAPTILHMFGLPIGKDMDGKVALDIFKEPTQPQYIDSWETVEGDFGQLHTTEETSPLDDQETMQQLVDLGYIEKPDEKIETAILKTTCDLKHNLARVFLGKKDFEKAKNILLELVTDTYPVYTKAELEKLPENQVKRQNLKENDSVIDVIPFYMDLLSIALLEKNFDKAAQYLKQLRDLDRNFEVNTLLSEAKILLGTGKTQQALTLLKAVESKNPSAEIWHQMGKIQVQLQHYNDAKMSFEKALEIEIDRAKFHQSLADVLIRLNDYETAAEHALTAIELVKYFPEAHYTLGEALEKLGDLENAKMAYETAAKLKPATHYRAEQAIENVADKLKNPSEFKDKTDFKYRDNQIVIVSGLPRSGTSLMMQMLDAGGVSVLTDANRTPDISNPKGYFEYDPVMSLHKDNSWLGLAQNKSVKVVAPLLKYLDPKYRYKVIFMNRDLTEVIKSQQKMIGKNPDVLPVKLLENFKKHLNQIENWKDKEPGVELIYINYTDALNNPIETVSKVTKFIGQDLNVTKMAACVDKSLYRNKN